MTTFQALIRRHPVLAYFALTFTISWVGILIVIGPSSMPITPEQSTALLPFVYVAMLLGPSLAGVIMTALTDGRTGLRELRSRFVRWRVDARWYAVALLTAPLLYGAVHLALSMFSPAFLPALVTTNDKVTLVWTGMAVGVLVGGCEEIGWTGFATSRLRQRHGLLTTGLIVGVMWGAWHFLTFWESDSFAATIPLALLLARLFSWLPPYRVLMVWVYDQTQSLLVAILMHASLVASTVFIFAPPVTGVELLTSILVWGAVVWAVAVSIVQLITPTPSPAQMHGSRFVVEDHSAYAQKGDYR